MGRARVAGLAGEHLVGAPLEAAPELYNTEAPANIFDWQRVLYIELAAKRIRPQEAALAGFIALSGDGATGTNCRLDEERLVAEFGVNRATLYRWLKHLVEGGWLHQTAKPTYAGERPGQHGRKGRAARYRVAWPRLEVRHDLPGGRVAEVAAKVRHDTPAGRVAEDPEVVRHDRSPESRVVSHSDQSRVAKPAESCRTATPDDASTPTSNAPTSNAPTTIHLPAPPTDAREPEPAPMDAMRSHPWRPDPWGAECLDCGRGRLHTSHTAAARRAAS